MDNNEAFKQILSEIKDLRTETNLRFDKLETKVDNLEIKVDKLEIKVDKLETDITEVKHRIILMENDIKQHNGAAYDSHMLFDKRTKDIQDSVDRLHAKQELHDLRIIRLDSITEKLS